MGVLEGKIALVTGASRGFGYAAARALAARGAHVIALARTAGGLEELDDEIKAAGGSATLTPADLKDDPALERLGAAIHERWGRLDLLLHAAAEPAPLSPAEHIAAKDFDRAAEINFRTPQRLIRVTDPLLRAAKGAQAIFIDDPDTAGAKFFGAYGAAKAAARALVLSYAEETAKSGLKVWLAVPPAMPTALHARFHPGVAPATLTPCALPAESLAERIIKGNVGAGETLRL